ncbi:MAG TPA: aminotransferase class III-fold pyridoxal phosphate-dependent enzyme [Candidatus Binataceae bacterium]|nr:aminotransferase class III-fold pyridoxal phosphate-dependent enzyme [Candidatus Binataceae bacterium]
MLEAKRVVDRETLYEKYVNPQWVRLLDVLHMNVEYTRCVGAELQTMDGRRILDFISGYCVHNVSHNHPQVIDALKEELDRNGPAMPQSHVSDLAGELAEYRHLALPLEQYPRFGSWGETNAAWLEVSFPSGTPGPW